MAKKERSKVYWWQLWFGVLAILWLATVGRCIFALAMSHANPLWGLGLIIGTVFFGIGLVVALE